MVDGAEDTSTYNLPVEIFVSSISISFSDIGCVGLGGEVSYSIEVADSDGNQIGQEMEMLYAVEKVRVGLTHLPTTIMKWL